MVQPRKGFEPKISYDVVTKVNDSSNLTSTVTDKESQNCLKEL